MKLPIIYYGNFLLRKVAKEIPKISEEIRQLVFDMIETMDFQNGIGLAAPQVGHSIRLFVIRNYIEGEDGHLHLSEPQVYINPVITMHSVEAVSDIEGCLSIPGIREHVKRPLHITVKAQDLEGHSFKEEIVGYKARVILHENDHLNGVLFVDRVSKDIRNKIDAELKQIKKDYNQPK
jgi:peptide deformylase